MNGKQYNSTGTDVELASAMLDNINELLSQLENKEMDETKKADMVSKLKFAKRFITGFANQL